MCYDDKAIPPVPPGNRQPAQGEELVLTAADGNRFAAYIARPQQPSGAQVLIYPDIRGLHDFYKKLAQRFAEVEITALAIDFFGRTAGLTSRDDTFDYKPHVQQIRLDTFFQDAAAALAYLREGEGARRSTFTLGFCFGGSISVLSGTEDFDLAGVICFYAGLARKMAGGDKESVLEEGAHVRVPLLGLFGGADQAIPVEQVHEFDANLDKAGVEHEIVIYPGAPHGFFDRRYADWTSQSEDAWKRVLSFITAHSSS